MMFVYHLICWNSYPTNSTMKEVKMINEKMKKIILLLATFYCTSVQSQNLITDVDGNLYKTVKIGEQVWMAENLKVNHYRNGDPIPTNLSDSIWAKTRMGAYTIYNNDFW